MQNVCVLIPGGWGYELTILNFIFSCFSGGGGGHFYAFYGLFLRSMNRMGIFLGVLKFQILFWVCLIFQIFFFFDKQ